MSEPARGDDTSRFKILAELAEKTERALQVGKLLKWVFGTLAGLVVAVALGTWAVAHYLGGLAKAEKVEEVDKRVIVMEAQEKSHDATVADMKVEIAEEHEDKRWIMRQMIRMSQAVKAPVEPLPEHERGGKITP